MKSQLVAPNPVLSTLQQPALRPSAPQSVDRQGESAQDQEKQDSDRALLTADILHLFVESSALLLGFLWLIILLA
jgi:hypothetical protein